MQNRHLTENEIQEYLDGNLSRRRTDALNHAQTCDFCRNRINEYQQLYQGLAGETEFQLPVTFSDTVLAKLENESVPGKLWRYWNIVWWVVGLLSGSAISVYYVGWPAIMTRLNHFYFSTRAVVLILIQAYSRLKGALPIDPVYIAIGGGVLLVVFAFDRFILQPIHKLTTS